MWSRLNNETLVVVTKQHLSNTCIARNELQYRGMNMQLSIRLILLIWSKKSLSKHPSMLATVAMKLTSAVYRENHFSEVTPDVVVVKSRIRLWGVAAVLEFTEFLREIDASGRTSQRFLQHRVVSLRRPCCAKAVGVAVWFLKHQICLLFCIRKVWMRY